MASATVKNKVIIPDFRLTSRVDQVGIEERVSRFQKRSIKKEAKVNGLMLVRRAFLQIICCLIEK